MKGVVVVGGSVAGWVLAADLRQRGFAGRIWLVDQAPRPSRRLINGCSLRGATLAHLAAASGRPVGAVIEALTGGAGTFCRLISGSGRERGGTVRWHRPTVIEETASPLGVSTRHGQITQRLGKLVGEGAHIERVGAKVSSREALATQLGIEVAEEVLWVNTTPNPALFGGEPRPAPRRLVALVQAPCLVASGGLRAPLREESAFAPLVGRPDGRHLMFFTPFSDEASPRATWYGINTRIVRAPLDEAAKAAALASVREGFERAAAALGLTLHDPDETLAAAVVPVDELPPGPCPAGTFNTARHLSSGAPAIYVDGMLAQAAGARAFVEALLDDGTPGRAEPFGAAARALAGVRRRNRLAQRLFATPIPLLRALMRLAPWPFLSVLRRDWRPDPGLSSR